MLESTCCDVLEERLDGVESAINSFFILINCIIIFFMKTGFALLEAGSVRAKNTTHILMKNLIDTALSCFIFWAIGYALCFGSDNNSFIGTHRFFLIQTPAKDYPLFFYELVYACASGTIVSGALAERAMIWGYIIYSTIMTGFIYPVVAHWIFNSGGWLYELGFIDKSGSCVIHVTGGVASLVGAIILGPRIGRFGKRGKVNSIPGHSTVLTTLGFFILWFGFLSFNAVSEKGIVGEDHNIEAPSRAIVATLLAGSGGLLSALIITKMSIRKAEVKFFKKEFHIINVFGGFWSIGASMNGSLAGIISICAGNDLYDPWDAFVIGSISGAIYCFYARLTLLIRVDDPVNAFAVHFGGGSWGTIALSLFLPDDRTAKLPNGGILYSWNRDAWRFFGIQLLGVTVVTAWVGVLSVFLFGSLQILHLFRASKRSEKAGLDYVNGQPAYPIDAALLQAFNPKISTSDEDEDEDDGDIDEFTADAEDEEEEDDEEEQMAVSSVLVA